MKIIITEKQLHKLTTEQEELSKKDIMDRVRLKLLQVSDGVKVFLVDGELVRDRLTIEYTMGGHHYRYPFIPENEVWIDNGMDRDDIEATIKHELHERNLMKYDKLSYSQAHHRASEVEKKYRKKHGMSLDNIKLSEDLNSYMDKPYDKGFKTEIMRISDFLDAYEDEIMMDWYGKHKLWLKPENHNSEKWAHRISMVYDYENAKNNDEQLDVIYNDDDEELGWIAIVKRIANHNNIDIIPDA